MDIDWSSMFQFEVAPLELIVRGTIIFWFIYLIMRCAGRRDFGSIGMANILLIVLIADAAQNAMSAEYKTVSEGMVLIGTLVFWSFFIDVMCYYVPWTRHILEPDRVCLIKNGVMQKRGMRREFITEQELMSELRLQGIDDVAQVRRAYIEQTGDVSILPYQDDSGSAHNRTHTRNR